MQNSMLQRTFIPGSEWLYFKVYTGANTADNILRNEIASIAEILKKLGLIDNWFYIRYSDPDFHLRIRIHIKELRNIGEVIILFRDYLNPLFNDHQIWKIQVDTYNRELERYDSLLIKNAESLFGIDTKYTLVLLKQFHEFKNENYRWQIALTMIDSLLSDFSYTINQKLSLLSALSLSFKQEFGFDEFNSKQFNVKYRENKGIIESVMSRNVDSTMSSLINIIEQKSYENRIVTALILDKIHISSKSLDELLSSYIHMMLNRLFRSRNRTHELILYDFMKRYYESSIAKSKYQRKY
jgi:thiopeptide-type bacteriocin biosynthesis protein